MTSREFAKLIGVSQSTVSRALNNSSLVSAEKKEYILRKAQEYSFELNSQAKSLRTRKTETIGILFPKHFKGMNSNLMLAYVYDCIQQEMCQYNYDIMVVYYDREENALSNFERIIRSHKVDGMMVLRMELSDREVELIEKYQVPCVFMLNASSSVRYNLNFLFSDSTYGGQLVGEYFGKFSEYRKMFLTVHEERFDAKRRLDGYRTGLESSNYTLTDQDILYCGLSIASAYQCITENIELFRREKIAMLVYGDMLAIGVVQALNNQGIPIPEQVQIIGMDDIPLTSILRPRISTVHVEVEKMVPKACRLLMDLIEKKEEVVQEWIKPHLVLRETTLGPQDTK